MSHDYTQLWLELSEAVHKAGITPITAKEHRRKPMTKENGDVKDRAATRRIDLMTQINASVANMGIAEQRVEDAKAHLVKVTNDAKAMVGTANAELAKLRTEYLKLRHRLEETLPGVIVEEDNNG
jgi:hypothetical protein